MNSAVFHSPLRSISSVSVATRVSFTPNFGPLDTAYLRVLVFATSLRRLSSLAVLASRARPAATDCSVSRVASFADSACLKRFFVALSTRSSRCFIAWFIPFLTTSLGSAACGHGGRVRVSPVACIEGGGRGGKGERTSRSLREIPAAGTLDHTLYSGLPSAAAASPSGVSS